MSEEVGFAFDKGVDRGRWQHRRSEGPGRTIVGVLTVLLLVGVLSGGAWYGYQRLVSAGDHAGPGTGEADTATVNKVILPEGITYLEVYDRLAKASGIPVAEFKKAGKDPQKLGVPALWFKRGDGKQVDKGNIEGFLYPATYELPDGATATDILKLIIKNFNAEMAELAFARTVTGKLNISPYEALVAASVAQVEALLDEDMAPVARVLYNRAYTGDFPCGCLQLDSTVNYWLRITGKQAKSSDQLLESELRDPDNPYRYNAKGMTIGPISNPGEVALKGAMNPPKSKFYFFVRVNEKGAMAYGETVADHERNIQEACRNGIPIC